MKGEQRAIGVAGPRATGHAQALSLFLAHFINDSYGSFLAPLLPLIIQRLDISLALAGLLGTVRTLTSSLSQPFLGYLSDLLGRRLFIVLGISLSVLAMSSLGLAGNYNTLVLLLFASGLGTSLFHPAAAALTASRRGGRGTAMALFTSGGMFGGAVAPVVIAAIVSRYTIHGVSWTIGPGLVLAIIIAWGIYRFFPPRGAWGREERRPRLNIGHLPGMLILIWFVIVFRSLTATAFSTFLPVLLTHYGASTLLAGAGLTVYLFAGALGGIIGGLLSDRLGQKAVIVTSMLLAAPLLLLFLHLPLGWALPSLALAGFVLFASNPVAIVAAQETLPGQEGLVSGLAMGLAWGVGGVALTVIGHLADIFSLSAVLTLVALLPLISGVLALFFRPSRRIKEWPTLAGGDLGEPPLK